MGNWYENMQAGADRARLRETEVQADEDRDREIQANIVAAEYKKKEEAYLATLRKNQLATQKAAADARAKALKVAEANELLAKGLTAPESPIGAAMDADGMPINIDKPYAGVQDFDIDAETETLVRYDEAGNVIEGGFLTDTEAKAKKEELKKLKLLEIEALKNDIIRAEEERKKAEPDKKKILSGEIDAINAQIKSLEQEPSTYESQVLGELDSEASLATKTAAVWASKSYLENSLYGVDQSLDTPGSIVLPWKWSVFVDKTEYDERKLNKELQKWLGRGGGLSLGSKFTDSYANDWFQEYGAGELTLFMEDPMGYYSRNKEAIEEMSGKKYNIPSSDEIATVLADDPAAQAKREADIKALQASLGIKSEELKKIKDDEGDPDKFAIFKSDKYKDTDEYKEGTTEIVTKYNELYADLQDATDDRDEALIKKIKSQLISNPAHRLLNNQAFGEDVDVIVGERSTLVKLFNTASSSGQLEQALTIKMAITTLDKQLWNKLVDKGILDLQSTGNGEILESAMSEHMGHEVRFQRRSDGNFHFFVSGTLYQNPETKKEYWTQKEISAKVSYEVNEGFEAAQKEYLASIAKKQVDGMLTETEAAGYYNAIIIQNISDNAAMQRTKLTEAGAKFSPMDANTGNYVMAANGNYWLMRGGELDIIEGTQTMETRFEKLDIPSSPTMLDISTLGFDLGTKEMRAYFASLGIAGFNNAGLNTISSP